MGFHADAPFCYTACMNDRYTRRSFLAMACASAGLAGIGQSALAGAERKKPNILFMMTDDHAAHAIGAYGSRINHTPHIDALARRGALFTNCFCTNPICTPSRAGILTGMYSHANGVPVFNDISPDIKTVGGYMRDAGYYTAFIGKWHLGGPRTVRDSDWDRWMVYANQGEYFNPWYWEKKDGRIRRTEYKGEYATENITRVTQDAIDRALAAGKPFFAMMHHKAPHRNWLPSPKYKARFRAMTLKDIPVPDTLFDAWEGRASPIKTTAMTVLRHMRLKEDLKLAEYFAGGGKFEFEGRAYEGRRNANGEYIDAWPEGMENDSRAKAALSYLRYMQDYLACVQSVDDSVGDMAAFLEKRGIARDTLVIYTSDQGFFLGDHGLYDKRFMMEEVIKMPFVAQWPAVIAPGTRVDDMVLNVDFAPTFLQAAGAPVPAGMQGRGFVENMKGRTPADWRKDAYFRYYVEGGEHATAAWYGIRTRTDKLMFYYKRGEWEYFDLRKDPEELDNAYSKPECAARIAQLKKRLARLRAALGDRDQYRNAREYGKPQP